jgi:hypothetical protein
VAKEKTNQEGPGAMKEGRKPKNKSQTWENHQKAAKHDPSCTNESGTLPVNVPHDRANTHHMTGRPASGD